MPQIIKKAVRIAGHPTSVSLEDRFWNALKDIAAARGLSMNQIITEVDETREDGNLSSALRVYILDYYSAAD